MKRVEEIKCERICLVETEKNSQRYGLYVFDEDKNSICGAKDYYDGKYTFSEVVKDEKGLHTSKGAEVLCIADVIDEKGYKTGKEFLQKKVGPKAQHFFFEQILGPSLGAGVDIAKLSEADKILLSLQPIKDIEK